VKEYMLILCALLSTCAACASPTEHPLNAYKLVLDPGFSPSEQASIVAAVENWEAATPVKFTIEIGVCSEAGPQAGEVCMVSTSQAVVEAVTGPSATEDTLAVTNYSDVGASVFVSTANIENLASTSGDSWLFFQTVGHELGHAQGLAHTPGVHALMDPLSGNSSHGPVTCVDVNQWYAVRGQTAPGCVD
jgi:hypothetical protein